VRPPVQALFAAALVLASAQVGWSRCGDDPGDAGAVAAARVQVRANCGCHSVRKHRDYVACAVGISRQRVAAGSLPARCRKVVKKCAAHSTCGKPGFVTCCLGRDASHCQLKGDEAHCTAKGGTPGMCDSCCDACAPGGCDAGLRMGVANTGRALGSPNARHVPWSRQRPRHYRQLPRTARVSG